MASVGAITPTERAIVPKKPTWRRSVPRRSSTRPRVWTPMADDATSEPRPLQARRLDGKRALVTGAARGIGRATLRRLVAEGARVAGLDLVEPGDAEVAIVADVSDEADVERGYAEALEAFGGLDIVVVNAATQLVGRDARADALELATWQRTIDVNLTGAFLTAKHGARALLAGDGGAIVF